MCSNLLNGQSGKKNGRNQNRERQQDEAIFHDQKSDKLNKLPPLARLRRSIEGLVLLFQFLQFWIPQFNIFNFNRYCLTYASQIPKVPQKYSFFKKKRLVAQDAILSQNRNESKRGITLYSRDPSAFPLPKSVASEFWVRVKPSFFGSARPLPSVSVLLGEFRAPAPPVREESA